MENSLSKYFTKKLNTAGKIKNKYSNWALLSKDPWILDIIKYGLKLDFSDLPKQNRVSIHPLSVMEQSIINTEINKMLRKNIILPTVKTSDDFISGVFTRPKKDGSHRMILNLKKFNQYINYKHFKMESIHNVINAIRPNVFMASVDLKDAFFSVPIFKEHQKYLKFSLDYNKYYNFVCMPNGYGPAMRVFTKLLKVPFSHLRCKGHISVIYVDDSYLQGNTFDSCLQNVKDTIKILRALGFTIHCEKSILYPTQKLTFLGFIFDSVNMSITLTKEKFLKIVHLCDSLCKNLHPTIREVAKVIGNLVASFPAVPYGQLHYRKLEHNKIIALKRNKGNFDAPIQLSDDSIVELKWWIDNIHCSFSPIHTPKIDITIYTDASKLGWGITDGINPSGGQWDKDEAMEHINVLELEANYIGIVTYCGGKTFKHVRVMTDNTTAIAYINNKGGIKSSKCNDIAKKIWLWCCKQSMWVSAAFIPGKENKEADLKSRKFNEAIEWKLNPDAFNKIVKRFGKPDIDLFATRINKQIDAYVSWQPEPEAIAVDAFSICWNDSYLYMFPPFSLVGKVLSKIALDQAHGIIVVPDWPGQVWYPQMLSMAQDKLLLPTYQNLLILPQDNKKIHPMMRKLNMLALKI